MVAEYVVAANRTVAKTADEFIALFPDEVSKLRLVSGSIVELKYDETESVNEKKYHFLSVIRRTALVVLDGSWHGSRMEAPKGSAGWDRASQPSGRAAMIKGLCPPLQLSLATLAVCFFAL